MSDRKVKIESRNEKFTSRIKSRSTLEIPADDNEFLVKETRIHGYNVLDLVVNCNFEDIFYLMFRGELPTISQKTLFRKLVASSLNLGPRHSGSRAAANAAVGRTDVSHIVPIANMAMSGEYNGAKEVELSMRFLIKSYLNAPSKIAQKVIKDSSLELDSDLVVAPGFGSDFGGQSPYLVDIKNMLLKSAPEDGYLVWADNFVAELPSAKMIGWRIAGVIAATLLDLDFEAREGGGVFQLLASVGAFSHGIQFANKPITEIPFLNDDFYEIENEK